MRHQKGINKLGRTRSHRKAMLANQASALIVNEYIVTTEAKAKACKSYVDKIFAMAKKDDLHTRRQIHKLLRDKLALKKLFDVLIKKFEKKAGGFTTIVKLGIRKGDNSHMSKLILIGSEAVRVKKARKASVKKTKAKKAKKTKKSKAKKEKDEQRIPGKRSLLDRVKALRGRFGAEKGKDQTSTGSKGVQAKSRSGI